MVGREVMRNDTVRHRKGARVTSPGAWNRCVMLILTMLVSCEAVFGSPGRLAGGIGAAKPKVIDNIANEDLPRGRNLEECDAVGAGQEWELVTADAPWTPRESFRVADFTVNGTRGIILVGGRGGNHVDNDVWFSPDGVDWTQVAVGIFEQRAEFGMAVAGDLLVIVGGSVDSGDGTCYFNEVILSRDLVNWETRTASTGSAPACDYKGEAVFGQNAVADGSWWSPREDLEVVFFENSLFLLGGEDAAAHFNDIWTSADNGTTWRMIVQAAEWAPREDHRVVLLEGALYLMGGEDEDEQFKDVFKSLDAVRWVKLQPPAWDAREDFDATVWRDRAWIVGGGNSDLGFEDLWSTKDFISWTRVLNTSCWGKRYALGMVGLEESLYILGGTVREHYNDVWKSPSDLLCTWHSRVCENSGRCVNNDTCSCDNGSQQTYCWEDPGLSLSLLVYGVLLVAAAIIILVGWWYLKFRKSRSKKDGGADLSGPGAQRNLTMSNLLPSLDVSDWRIDYDQVQVAEKIGAGGAGQVWKARYAGASVALKQLYSNMMDETDLEELRAEATLLSRLRHPNIVHFYGVCITETDVFLVTEYCGGGSVLDLLLNKKRELPLVIVVQIALEIAQGMEYLHAQRVLHRDLKPENVLLDNSGGVRICDFGLARVADTGGSMTVNKGTPAFMAPETMSASTTGAAYSTSVDVYSFGILLWALLARNMPYDSIGVFAIPGEVARGRRPEISDSVPEGLRSLMERCWDVNAATRPSFAEVAEELRDPDIVRLSHTQEMLFATDEALAATERGTTDETASRLRNEGGRPAGARSGRRTVSIA